ncbi:hypothetical protein [Paenibacillus senegalimassiliensis]|uniref:hypothetical protein n=1 Tax=Paenibacillus senegalimassiliensis TaxID=1737426 RepID=UPI0016526D69|nr:hypothetical protein [Paenibacillus senegalimassiliensis]
MARLINEYALSDGVLNQSISRLTINRYAQTDTNWIKVFYLPSVLFVAQGVKDVHAGAENISS